MLYKTMETIIISYFLNISKVKKLHFLFHLNICNIDMKIYTFVNINIYIYIYI